MRITHMCFECKGEKWHTIPHECGGPDVVPCEICKGEGILVYDEVQIQHFFPDYVLPKASDSSAITQRSGSRKEGLDLSHE